MKRIAAFSILAALFASAALAQTNQPIIPPGKLAVFKAGTSDGKFPMVTARVAPCFVQVFDTVTNNQASPALSVALSTNQAVPGSVWINHHAGSEGGGLSRSTDRQFLALEGYTGNILSPTAAKPSTDQTVTRGIVTLDAFTNAISVYSDLATWFGIPAGSAQGTQDNPTGIASVDGTNFWGTGNFAGTSGELSGTLFYSPNVAGAPYEVQNYIQAAAEARIIGGTLYIVVPGGGVYNFVNPGTGDVVPLPYDPNVPNPYESVAFTNLFINWGSIFKKIANFDMNPAGTIAYGADQTFGIVKFTNNGGVWTQAPYYFSATNLGTTAQTSGNQGCFGICVDFSGANPVIYATTMENGYPTPNTAAGHQNQNRLIKVVDTGVDPGSTMVAQTLAIAATTNEFFGGIDFTPDLRPLITSDPASYSTTNGGSASFSISAQSVYAVTYQWLQNGTNLSGATSSTLNLAGLDTSFNNYLYQCVATNNYGAVTSAPATLIVTASPVAPAITSGTNNVPAFVGSKTTFAPVTASGTEPFTYQWYQGSTLLTDDGVKYSGSTTASLTISNLTTADSGSYYAVVANAAGYASNVVDILTVNYHLATISPGQPLSVTTFAGLSTSLTATSTGGTDPVTNQWYRGNVALTDGSEFSGTSTPTLTISPAAVGDSGTNYYIVVSNPGGAVTSQVATVSVIAPPPHSSVGYSNELYTQNFDSLPDPGGVSVNSINNPLDNGSINGVAYSLANPFDFTYPVILNSYVGGLGISKLAGWYGAADTNFAGVDGITRFGAQDGDQSTGGVIDFGPNDVNGGVVGTNRALGLLSTGTTGSTTFALKLVNTSGKTNYYLDIGFVGELWRNNTGTRTMSFGYTYDTGATNFVLTSSAISNSTLVPSLAFNFPTSLVVTPTDGTQPSNQVSLVTNNMPLASPWAPGDALWLIWSVEYYGSGGGQGYAIDNLIVDGTTNTTTAPLATTTAASKITSTSAQLNSTITPNNGPTTFWFQYGPTVSYGSSTATNFQGIVTGSGTASTTIAGLSQLTGYHYRVGASNIAGVVFGSDQTFTTLTNPVVTTSAASSVNAGSGTLNGSVNPNNNAATYWFQYGTSTSYGSFTATNNLASGSSAVAVNVGISGLQPNTTYHYRLVGSTAAATVNGSDKTLTTLAVTPPTLGNASFSGGNFQLSFTDTAGASFNVYGTNNLLAPKATWPLIGHAVENPAASGHYFFTNSVGTNSVFYYYVH